MADVLAPTAWNDMQETTTTRLLTTEKAAHYLGVSARTVKNLMADGRLPFVKIGRSTRLDPADLNDFIAQNRRKQRHPRRRIS